MKKKCILLLMALLLALQLCACAKPEAAQNVDDLIMQIGSVSLNSSAKIEEAEEAFAALKRSEQKKVESADTLREARSRYDTLKAQHEAALVAEAENAIKAIGTVTVDSKEVITRARTVYDTLDAALQPRVQNISVLTQAENDYLAAKAAVVDEAIGKIGKVSADSDQKISNARNAYEALNDEEKALVQKYDVLVTAERTVIEKKAEKVMKSIDLIGTVTLDSGAKIRGARSAYDKYNSEEVHKLVTNYDVLTKAEKKYAELRANPVIELINGIGAVTLQSGEKIDAADKAYNDLNSDEKKLVSNVGTLNSAKRSYDILLAEEKERVGKAALAKLTKKEDKVQGCTFYQSPSQPYYADTRSYTLPYIGQRGDFCWLRWKIHYTGDDWVFWKKLTFHVDGTNYTRSYSYFDVERDNDSGDVWEYVDVSPTSSDVELLRKIAQSEETIVRFEGDAHHYDLTISSSDKKAIQDVLDAYDYLTNK